MTEKKANQESIYRRFIEGEYLNSMEYCAMREYLEEKEQDLSKFIPVIACRDNDGHWYVIPENMGEDFNDLLDKSTDHEIPTSQREQAEDDFIKKYSQYMTGGDVNLTQLYVKVETTEQAMERESKLCSDWINGSDCIGPDVPGHSFDEDYANAPAGTVPMPKLFPRLLDHTDTTFLNLATMAPKKSALEMVEEFHTAFNCPVLKTPAIPDQLFGNHLFFITGLENVLEGMKKLTDPSRSALRMKLILEEFIELYRATYDGDMVGALDGLTDLLYVIYGTHHEFGTAPIAKEAITEVHRSNMSKLNGDGTPIVRNDGKILKGPNFTPPDLAGIIGRYNFKNHPEKIKNVGMSASLGANLPQIPGMPEPANDGVIYSDLKVGDVTQSDDGSLNIEITGIKHTPVESIRANIEFKQPPPDSREYGRDEDQTYPHR